MSDGDPKGPARKNPRGVTTRKWGVERAYYLTHVLYSRGHRRAAYFLKFLNTFLFRAYIPPQVSIGLRLDLPHGIGNDVVIGANALVTSDVPDGSKVVAPRGIILGES